MQDNKMLTYINEVIKNMPTDWLNLTTHRLDIYDESLAKTEFLDLFENLYNTNTYDSSALSKLPTAYDYIRLGHPLSSVLEWTIANLNNTKSKNVISFSSKTTPILAVLRKNLLEQKDTQIVYTDQLPPFFDAELIKRVYGYSFDLKHVESINNLPQYNGSTIYISQQDDICNFNLKPEVDFYINTHSHFGSVLLVNGTQNESYVSEIQHVRRSLKSAYR